MSFDTFISATGHGLARAARAKDASWTVEHLLTGEYVRCLAADPWNADVVYAGSHTRGILRSTDRGHTWEAAGLEGKTVTAVAISKLQPGTIYAATKPLTLFISTDNGGSWRELEALRHKKSWWWFTPAESPPTQPYVLGLALSPTDSNVIMAGIEFGAVLRSADGGKTWSKHRKGAIRDCHNMTFHATDGNWVYEGGGGGAAFSQDGGVTWTQPEPITVTGTVRNILRMGLEKTDFDRRYGWAVAADPAQPDIWYCSTAPGPSKAHGETGDAQACIFRSKGGSKWQRLSGGLPQPLDYMPYALVTDVSAPGHLFAGLSNGDIWHTTDHGDSWAQLPVNLKTIYRTMIAL